MSFRCAVTRGEDGNPRQIPPGEPSYLVTTHVRRTTYPMRSYRYGHRDHHDNGGEGIEIVKQIRVSWLGKETLERQGFKPTMVE